VTGMGKSGSICRKIAATLLEHRHVRLVSASRRGDPRRSRRDREGRCRCWRCRTAARPRS
jgi:hypothetical protein